MRPFRQDLAAKTRVGVKTACRHADGPQLPEVGEVMLSFAPPEDDDELRQQRSAPEVVAYECVYVQETVETLSNSALLKERRVT